MAGEKLGLQTGHIHHSHESQTSDYKEVAQIVLDNLKPYSKDFSFIYTVKYGVTYQVVGYVYKEKTYGLFEVSSFDILPKYIQLKEGVLTLLK